MDQPGTAGLIADGATFTMQRGSGNALNTTQIGAFGGALGFGGAGNTVPTFTVGITNSIGLRFDTWNGNAAQSTLGMVYGGIINNTVRRCAVGAMGGSRGGRLAASAASRRVLQSRLSGRRDCVRRRMRTQ